MAQHAPLVAIDRAALGTISVHDQPRGPAQWRGGKLSGYGVRSGRVGSSAASKALQAGLPSVPEADSIDLAAAAVVTRADCRLAKAHISGGASKAGVTRDDLSQPVHSGTWRAEKGASRAPEGEAHGPPIQARQHEAERARPD